jgi:transcriptional regulator with XRE-family HTH domain
MQQLFITQNASEETLVYDAVMHPGGRPTQKARSSLGLRLAEARVRAGLSQAKLAELMGTTQPAVAYWERTAENLRSDVVARLAKILEISSDELLGTRNHRPRFEKPTGKARQLFEAVSKMPRRQQEKVFAVLEPFVTQHAQAREA